MKSQSRVDRCGSRSLRLLIPIIALALVCGVASAKKPPQPPPEPPPEPQSTYRLIDLGTLGGFNSSGFKINNLGWVVGESRPLYDEFGHAIVVVPESTDGDTIPDLWFRDDNGDGFNDLMIDLGVLGGGTLASSLAWGINDEGQVVGESTVDVTEGSTTHAFLWQDLDGDRVSDPGEMVDLGSLSPGGNSRAVAVNTWGQVVGCSDGPAGDHAFLINPILEATGNPVWYTDGNGDGLNDLMIDLGNVSWIAWEDLDINDAGEIVGTADGVAFLIRPVVDNNGILHWFADENSDGINDLMILLPPVSGAKTCRAKAINASGLITGSSKGHAVFWQVDAAGSVLLTDLGGLENEDGTDPYDLNDDGLVVGCALTIRGGQPGRMHYTYRSWLLENGSHVDLSDRIVDWGGFLAKYGIKSAFGVNSSSQIVGGTEAIDGNLHAYIAVPVQ